MASLVAASLVPVERRAQAISRILLGLTVATIFGVPAANIIGQIVGWRWAFALVTALSLATAVMVLIYAPRGEAQKGGSPLDELRILKNRQVWLILGIGAIGFGGLFAVYTYLASTLLDVTHASPEALPFVLAAFGVGLTLGNFVGAWFADKALMPTAAGILLWVIVALALYPFATHSIWAITLVVFLIGGGGGLVIPLQARLMEVAEGAQTLAAALNHSAFNVANALGPWFAGMAIAAGFGWQSAGWVGCAMAVVGLLLWLIAVVDARNSRQAQARRGGRGEVDFAKPRPSEV